MSQEFLQCFLSHDNSVRSNAEQQLSAMVSNNFLAGINLLGQGLQLPQNELAEMASVLFCRFYLDKEESFQQIQQQTLLELVQLGKQQLLIEAKLSYLKRMSDLVVKILLRLEQYDDMVKFILSYPADSLNKKLTLMYFIEIMCEFAFDDNLLVKYSEALNQVFERYLNDGDPQVRVSALRSLTTFLASVENSATLVKFQQALPLLLRKVVEAVQLDQVTSVSALQSLSELLESHPKFLQNSTSDLLLIFSEIMESNKLISDLRRASLHGLQTLCHSNPVQVRKSDIFKQRTAVALMKMLTEVESSQKEWESDMDDNCLQSQEISSAAQDCLAKISGDLNVKFLLPLLIKMIVPALQSQDWKERHAGLVAMAMLSEGSVKYFKNDLDSIMQSVIPLAQSNNIRTHYDILTCIALLCQEFHPIIQQKYGQQILQLIVGCIQQDQSLKLQYRAISCLVDFCRELMDDDQVAKDVVSPYAQGLLEVLYGQVQLNLSKQPLPDRESRVAKEALTALSVLAASLKDNFAKYYDTMLPVMTKIMQQIQVGDQYIEIRTLLIECLGFMLGSIADTRIDQFTIDANQLLQQFLSYQQTLVADDQQHVALFSFYSQIAQGMKTGFAPYLSQVFDFVEKAINIDLGFSIGDSVDNQQQQQQSNSKVTKIKLDLKFVGLKQLELNTSALEQKIEGAHTLLQLCESCTKAFGPYLQRASQLVVNYINYKHSRDIRETMSKCIYHMMLSCNNKEEESMLLNSVLPSIVNEAQVAINRQDISLANVFIQSITDAVEILQQPTIVPQLLDALLQLSASSLQLCSKQKNDALNDFTQAEQDDEQKDKLQDDLEELNEIIDSIVTLSSQLAKVYGTTVQPQIINNLMPIFYQVLVAPNSNQEDLTNSIAFFNGILPYCSNDVFEKGFEQITPIYNNIAMKSNDLQIKQNILFGLGEFGKRTALQQYSKVIPLVQELALSILSQNDAKSEDKINSYETAIGTLGKLGMFQNQDEMLNKFIDSLPLLQSDAGETHLLLLQQVEKQNPNLIKVQDKLLIKLKELQNKDNLNPENEILCDQGRQIINKLLC